MQLPNTNFWMVRAGRDGTVIRRFLNEGIAYLGWGEVGSIHTTDSNANIRKRLDENCPYERAGARPNIVGMLKRFSCEVRIGDTVVTYDPQRRLYHIGTVKSDAYPRSVTWVDLATKDEFEGPGYVRKVDWVSAVSRDSLSLTAQRCLNGQLSHFQLPAEVSAEIRRLCA